jgi:hypothetical protein
MKITATVAFTYETAGDKTLPELEEETERRIAETFATDDVRAKVFFPRHSWAEAKAAEAPALRRRRRPHAE